MTRRRFWLFVRQTFRESSGIWNAISFFAFGLGMLLSRSIGALFGIEVSDSFPIVGAVLAGVGFLMIIATFAISFHFLGKRYPYERS